MKAADSGVTAGGGNAARGRAVVCVSDDAVGEPVRHTLGHHGFDVLADVDRGIEVLPAVAEYEPDVVVLGVALLGTLGIRLLQLITALSPDVAIVAVSPIRTLDLAMLEAGARAVVSADDLRGLSEALNEIAPARATRGNAS